MTDLLIRDVPDEIVASIDQAAHRMGLSRVEYLRRTLARDYSTREGKVTTADLERTAEVFSDLDDPEVMRRAWE